MRRYCLSLLALPLLAHAETPLSLSERDFFADLPVVLSVSRLPQPIDETPGAVTVIDRDLIRVSGARNVADLMRLVPGFQVSDSVVGSAPLVAYHGGFSEVSNHMQVLIDRRSVYSPFRLGDTSQGMQTLALEDIERIEVIRGSDSTAYGARAVQGVINVVTRDPTETHGLLVSKTAGDNGIDDSLVRYGWGEDGRNFRLTAETRGDAGLTGAHGANHLSNVNFRADWRPNATDEWEFRAGNSDQFAGTGAAGNPGDPEREVRAQWRYLQLDWRRTLAADADLAMSYSHTDTSETNDFPVALPPPFIATTADFGGSASNDVLSVQHTFSPGRDFRLVWGGELRSEQVRSVPLYNKPGLSTQFRRLFGNLEWRIAPVLVLNAGSMIEHSSLSGADSAPRLMLNWHLTPGQTLRFGRAAGNRPPSMFEKAANIRYVVNGTLLQETYVALGQVQPEHFRASEIGYLGDFPALAGSIDLRVFRERIDSMVGIAPYALPANTKLNPPQTAIDFVNLPSFVIRGAEYQLKVKLASATRLLLNQSLLRNDGANVDIASAIPRRASSLLLIQRFAGGAELSLGHYRTGQMSWQGVQKLVPATQRTDLRLGMPFRVGGSRCEAAVTVQNIGQPYSDFLPTYQFQRQAFASLTVQF